MPDESSFFFLSQTVAYPCLSSRCNNTMFVLHDGLVCFMVCWYIELVYATVTSCICTNFLFREWHAFCAKTRKKMNLGTDYIRHMLGTVYAHLRHSIGTVKEQFCSSLGTVLAQSRHSLARFWLRPGTVLAWLKCVLRTFRHALGARSAHHSNLKRFSGIF